MEQLPCIIQYVLGKRLKTVIPIINTLTDTIFSVELSSALSFDMLIL